jgi:hypothetical protein
MPQYQDHLSLMDSEILQNFGLMCNMLGICGNQNGVLEMSSNKFNP